MGQAIDTPSGDLKRDLAAHRRVQMWRPQPQVASVRAMQDMGEGVLRFVLATPGVKRDGHSVDCAPTAWRLDAFRARPVALWSHGYGDKDNPPLPQIGEWRSIDFEQVNTDWRMVGDLQLSRSWDLPQILYRMYLPADKGGDGFRGATSIGWTPFDAEPNGAGGYHMKDNELNEASLVAMGADQDAVQVMQRAINSGTIPEKYGDHLLAANRLIRAAEGKAYLLDFRERIVRGAEDPDPEVTVRVHLDGEAIAKSIVRSPVVRIIDSGADETVIFERVHGNIGAVLEHRGGKPDQKDAQRQGDLCRAAFSEKKLPKLDAQWRAIPVIPGRAMLLSRLDGKSDGREGVLRALTESLEKGTPVVLPAGWTLSPVRSAGFTRSDRSDELDALFAQLSAFLSGASYPLSPLYWALSDIFCDDAEDEADGGADEAAEEAAETTPTTEQIAARQLNVIVSLLTAALDTATQMQSALEPPAVLGANFTASLTRVGKKYSANTVKKLKTIADHHAAAGSIVSDLLEEAQAMAATEDQTASGNSEFARIAEELDAAAAEFETRSVPETTTRAPDPPVSEWGDLARSFEPPTDVPPATSSLAELTESLRGAA